jgi:DNA-cytosine methyltransferase
MDDKWYMIDLFSGLGGFHQGFEKAGWHFDKVYFSEIDKNAVSIYKRRFPDAEHIGSVVDVRGAELKARHPDGRFIVTFGFPCQDLSLAGRRKGFDGSRSSLFFEAIRIIDELHPDYFVAENVKGFYSSNNGRDFTIALRTIADIGYDAQWQLVNTRWLLPQNRERIYIVGFPGGTGGRKIFPVGESRGRADEAQGTSRRDGERLWSDNTPSLNKVGNIYPSGGENGNIYDASGICPAIKSGETDNEDNGGVGSCNSPKIIAREREREREREHSLCHSSEGLQGRRQPIIIGKDGQRKMKNHASAICGGGHSGGNHSDMDLVVV